MTVCRPLTARTEVCNFVPSFLISHLIFELPQDYMYNNNNQLIMMMMMMMMMMKMIQQFVRHRNMSKKSLQERHTACDTRIYVVVTIRPYGVFDNPAYSRLNKLYLIYLLVTSYYSL